MSRIVWLASYPKSGNTWLRLLLANFLRRHDGPADINNLSVGRSASARRFADAVVGVECSDLTSDEIDLCRPDIYRSWARSATETLYVKTHEAYTRNLVAEPLFPSDITYGAIYIIRNPLDLCVSFAHHSAMSIDQTVSRMELPSAALSARTKGIRQQFMQKLSSWSSHVTSWLDQREIRVHAMRYEDMCAQPDKEFEKVVAFLGLEPNRQRIRNAVESSSFEALRRQELEHGFREKPSGASIFFRKGRPGEWRSVLDDQQVHRILQAHGSVMDRFFYPSEVQSHDCHPQAQTCA